MINVPDVHGSTLTAAVTGGEGVTSDGGWV